jgi:hypothetical protein
MGEPLYKCKNCGKGANGLHSICLHCFQDELEWNAPLKFKKDGEQTKNMVKDPVRTASLLPNVLEDKGTGDMLES